MNAILLQFLRFAGIGFLNTAVDFAVFNIIASYSGAYVGISAGIIKACSFVVAMFHSFYWNKYWAFAEDQNQVGISSNIKKFISAAVLGAVVAGLIITGSGAKLGYQYFGGMLLLLIGGEIFLWELFRLNVSAMAEKTTSQFASFLIVSAIGAAINSGVVAVLTTKIPPQFSLPQSLWTNLIVVFAIGIALIWNFIGYKIFVFKK